MNHFYVNHVLNFIFNFKNLPDTSNECIENVDHQLKSLQIDGSSILALKDTPKIESE